MLRLLLLIALFFSCNDPEDVIYPPVNLNLDPSGIYKPTKKGVAFNKSYSNTWDTKFQLLNPVWHYSWNWELLEEYPEGVEFVPMIWDERNVNEDNLSYLEDLANDGSINYLLGFNEPDLISQANMTVEEAIALWPDLESVGVPLGSPVTASTSSTWFSDFMSRATEENLRIDFVSVHIYDVSDVDIFVQKLEDVFEKYGKPIWITEFALRDWRADNNNPNRYSEEDVLLFMQQLLPRLEELDFVHRYAWFDTSPNNPNYEKLRTADLITENNQLTSLGAYYSSFIP